MKIVWICRIVIHLHQNSRIFIEIERFSSFPIPIGPGRRLNDQKEKNKNKTEKYGFPLFHFLFNANMKQ